jgi:hypothetical protein
MRLRTIVIVGLVLWGALAAIAAIAFAIRPVAATATPRTLSATVPVADHAELDLTAAVGNVDVRASADPAAKAVDVRVDLRAKGQNFWWGGPVADPGELGLVVSEARGGVVRVHVGGGSVRGLEENWTVTVPVRFSARVKLNVGDVKIAGLAGAINASVDVGSIDAESSAERFGPVDVQASVGSARVNINGRDVEAPKAPGPSSRVRTSGDGTVPFTLSVSVGDARLRIR